MGFCIDVLKNNKKVINTKVSAVSSFYGWSVKRKLIKYHPFDYMGKRRFDWKIFIGDKIYYVEYFGLFSKNPKRDIDKKYLINTKYKINKLYQYGYIDNYLFIFIMI